MTDKIILTEKETYNILEEFYRDCLIYWLSAPHLKNYEEASVAAIKDVKPVKYNPLVPEGNYLSVIAKQQFIKDIKNNPRKYKFVEDEISK